MSGKFILASEVERQQWPGMGEPGLISLSAGSKVLVFADLVFAPGDGFNFHHHPHQEEVLYLMEGSLEAWVGQEKHTMNKGDTMYLPPGAVHANFNVSEQEARMFVVLTPVIESEELGLELVDVSEEAPWNALRG